MSQCREVLRSKGRAYPRTCGLCGLGPCKLAPAPAPPVCSCGRVKDREWHLACGVCWSLVPPPLQAKVYYLYQTKNGTPAHTAAVRECFTIIHAKRS
jgi:hypothetical protein